MTQPSQLSQVGEMAAHDEAVHEEHIHLPGPSIWPLALALGIFLIGVGLASELAFAGAGVVIMVGAMAGWIAETRKQAIELEGREGPPRYVHTVLFQYMSHDEDKLLGSHGLRAQIDQHLLAIKGMPGLVEQRVMRTDNSEGPVQMIVTTTWKDADGLADYEESGATLEGLLKAQEEIVVPGSVQVYDLQDNP
jgi:heme-degrading monooxygenase HmoA